MLIVLLLSKKLYRTPSLVGFRDDMWPFARVGHLRTVSSPEGDPGCKVDAEAVRHMEATAASEQRRPRT